MHHWKVKAFLNARRELNLALASKVARTLTRELAITWSVFLVGRKRNDKDANAITMERVERASERDSHSHLETRSREFFIAVAY